MAQIEPSDKGGKKKKGAQKKMSIHVDFTPMVDMNMLLITFFMLCTTMIKSQTVQIILPAKQDTQNEQKSTQARADLAMTLILDTEYDDKGQPLKDEEGNTKHRIYYYEYNIDENGNGVPDLVNANTLGSRTHKAALALETYKGNENGKPQGIRAILHKRNEAVMKEYDKLKEQYAQKKVTKEEFEAKALELAKNADLQPAVIILKAGPNATYENVINAFDELQLNQIRKYSFEELNHEDTIMLRNFENANPGFQVFHNNVRGK